jgi:hypothetical protein
MQCYDGFVPCSKNKLPHTAGIRMFNILSSKSSEENVHFKHAIAEQQQIHRVGVILLVKYGALHCVSSLLLVLLCTAVDCFVLVYLSCGPLQIAVPCYVGASVPLATCLDLWEPCHLTLQQP